MGLGDYLELTTRFRGERDRNVWSILLASFGTLNRLIDPAHRPRLAALVRDRVAPVFGELGWTPRSGEDELTRQLRGDLVRVMGVLGDDRAGRPRRPSCTGRRPTSIQTFCRPSSACSPTRATAPATTSSWRSSARRRRRKKSSATLRSHRLSAARASVANARADDQRRVPHQERRSCALALDVGLRARGRLGIRQD
jgi:hypothetical protein